MKIQDFKRFIKSFEQGLIKNLEIVLFEKSNTEKIFYDFKIFGLSPNGLELCFSKEKYLEK